MNHHRQMNNEAASKSQQQRNNNLQIKIKKIILLQRIRLIIPFLFLV